MSSLLVDMFGEGRASSSREQRLQLGVVGAVGTALLDRTSRAINPDAWRGARNPRSGVQRPTNDYLGRSEVGRIARQQSRGLAPTKTHSEFEKTAA